jgi:hypothetical protein
MLLSSIRAYFRGSLLACLLALAFASTAFEGQIAAR